MNSEDSVLKRGRKSLIFIFLYSNRDEIKVCMLGSRDIIQSKHIHKRKKNCIVSHVTI